MPSASNSSNPVWEAQFRRAFGLLVDRQWGWKEDRALVRRLRNSKLRGHRFGGRYRLSETTRTEPFAVTQSSAESEWVKQHLKILLIGATGVGKSWLAAGAGAQSVP